MSSTLDSVDFRKLVFEHRRFNALEMSQHFSVDVRSLARHFRKRYGSAPQHKINVWRLELAKHLIEKGHPIKCVAVELGFVTLAHFSREFRRVHGHCPRQTLLPQKTSFLDNQKGLSALFGGSNSLLPA